MNRRDWFKTWGSASALPLAGSAAPARSSMETEIRKLKLRHTWTTTMSSSEFRETLHVAFRSGGVIGRGEGAPIVRYHESAQSAQKAGSISA